MYNFLFVIIEIFLLALTVEALEGKTCQDSLLSGGVGQLESRFEREGVVREEYFFWFLQRHILSANCTVLHAVVLTIPVCDRRTDRSTDGQTDGQTDRRN